jgi:hypothetical protein
MTRAGGSWGAIVAKTIALTPAMAHMAHPKATAPKIIVAAETHNLPTCRTTDRNPCGAFFAAIPRSTISISKEARQSPLCPKVCGAQTGIRSRRPRLPRVRSDCSKRPSRIRGVAKETIIGNLKNLPTIFLTLSSLQGVRSWTSRQGSRSGLAGVNLQFMEAEKISSGRRLRLVFPVV